MKRTILHCDLNAFYASVEILCHPELRKLPVVVGGDVKQRQGIVLAKNDIAKQFGIKTGEVLWQAKQKCPNVVIMPPDYRQYLRFSRLTRDIYSQYTDQIESFGIDEAWLDVSGSTALFGSGVKIANEIRQKIKEQLGLTISVGVSDNKIFAKLGSDYKKPDAVSVIDQQNFQEIAWPLPVTDLLYVGAVTAKKLADCNIHTIGELARFDRNLLRYKLGKWGESLWNFANGLDKTPVRKIGTEQVMKSVGNSLTCPRDLTTIEDIQVVVTVLSESVAARLREHGLRASTIQVNFRDQKLQSFTRQVTLAVPTCLGQEIVEAAMTLCTRNDATCCPIRSVGVGATKLIPAGAPYQLDLFGQAEKRRKQEQLAHTLDNLRTRFGWACVKPGLLYIDRKLGNMAPKEERIIHPASFFMEDKMEDKTDEKSLC